MAGGLPGQLGGIVGLTELIDKHSEAIEFDLIALGLRLRDIGATFNWRDLLVIVRRSARDSALNRDINPTGWNDTWETLVLEEIVDRLIALTMYHGNNTKTHASKIPRGVLREARENPVSNRERTGAGMSIEEIERRRSAKR